MFSIYIHIPFCIQKCLYCDFLSGPCGEDGRKSYLEALHQEVIRESPKYHDREVNTIFLGGGTPSVLETQQTQELMELLFSCFRIAPDAEITTELNPGTAAGDKLRGYRQCGINRLSIGLQSADQDELKRLGRIHTVQEFEDCFYSARECGFTNVNVDVMSALPGQDCASWERTLRYVCSLKQPPEHISAYSLIVEEGTPFYARYGENGEDAGMLPDEEEDRRIYHRTKELLEDYGYARYEISNYARPGYACRHNEAYWLRTDYAGFGLGAASMVDHVRWENERQMEIYENTSAQGGSVRKEIRKLSIREQMEEFCFLGLRRTEGISGSEFAAQFGTTLESVYGRQIKMLRQQGLLAGKERLHLTEYGTDISNYVFLQFLQDD